MHIFHNHKFPLIQEPEPVPEPPKEEERASRPSSRKSGSRAGSAKRSGSRGSKDKKDDKKSVKSANSKKSEKGSRGIWLFISILSLVQPIFNMCFYRLTISAAFIKTYMDGETLHYVYPLLPF